MSKLTLPARPKLEQLKKQAKELLGQIRDRDPGAVALFARHHPKPELEGGRFALHDAQLVLARQYGFVTWARLKDEVERVASDFSQRANRLVFDAVDGDFSRARRALALEPELARTDRWVALVVGELSVVGREISLDPLWVSRRGGPCDWAPLLYVSFSRFQMEDAESQRRFTNCVRLLLDAGADPNVAWVHPHWENSPLKPLYGATGVNNNPLLARLLLERGAEVDDGESIYHAAQFDHAESLEVLAEFGVSLGRHPRWGNTPLYFLLGTLRDQAGWDATARGIRWLLDRGSDPNVPCGEKGETALHVAVRQGHDPEIIRWLLEAGANPNRADKDGMVPVKLAHLAGRADTAALLIDHGACDVKLGGKDRFFAAVFSADQEMAMVLLREDGRLVATFGEEDRLALNRAAEHGNIGAVRILLDCGFDIAFKGAREWGSTPLHGAAWHGQAEVVELLLSRGAPIGTPANPPAEGVPLAWAAHGSSNCRNPRGDYARVVRALLGAGATPMAAHAEMASPQVAEILYAALAGNVEEAEASNL
jgi:ankyrin repeat protein